MLLNETHKCPENNRNSIVMIYRRILRILRALQEEPQKIYCSLSIDCLCMHASAPPHTHTHAYIHTHLQYASTESLGNREYEVNQEFSQTEPEEENRMESATLQTPSVIFYVPLNLFSISHIEEAEIFPQNRQTEVSVS